MGERVFRLPPLACPPEQPMLTAAQLLSYPAVQLFVERASARGTDFKLSDDDGSAVTEICRKLDGVPLAIELAAMRAAMFGLKDTAAKLGSRLDLLKFGRRPQTRDIGRSGLRWIGATIISQRSNGWSCVVWRFSLGRSRWIPRSR